ncbi:hypothetical protein D3C77_279670 [compost metagenome]
MITLKWLGVAGATYTFSVTVDASNSSAPIPIAIAYEPYIIRNLDTSVSVTYEVRRKNGSTARSAALVFRIERQLGQNLVAPTVKEAPNNTNLDPTAAKDTLTIVVPHFTGMLNTDRISAIWTGAAGTPAEGSHTSTPVLVGTVGIKEIVIPNTVVAFNLGKPVTVRYSVIRDGTPVLSATLTLAVLPLSASALTAPKILQGANGGEGPELDVSALTSNATLRQASWPLIALGQYVWLRLRGTLANGAEYHKVLWQPPTGTTNSRWITNGYFDAAVLLSELKELKDGSTLTVEFKAALGRSQSEAEAVTFPSRTYTVRALVEVRPVITSVKDPQNVEIPDAGTTVHTSVTLSGSATKDQKVEIFDGASSKGIADVGSNGLWTYTVTGLSVAAHSFTAKALYGSGQVSTPAWTLTVVPELILDPAPMVLNGINLSLVGSGIDFAYTGTDPLNTTETRSPTGGHPPYVYTTSNPLVASVDNAGLVRSEGNGTATITVSDQKGTTATFQVETSNVTRCLFTPNLMDYSGYLRWVAGTGGRILTPPEIIIFYETIHHKFIIPPRGGNNFQAAWHGDTQYGGAIRFNTVLNVSERMRFGFGYYPPGTYKFQGIAFFSATPA